MRNKPELLAPAGNFAKLEAAVRYGADAVYLSGEAFGMRAAADNFSLPEIRRAVEYAHARGAAVYVTVNTMPRTHEYDALSAYLKELGETGADALIIADIGVLTLARELAPKLKLHISTQAGAVSHADCAAWYALGASRVVLARELTLSEIKEIRSKLPEGAELEVFVHGSMCVSWSGRCLLSAALTGRDANRGMCAQPCRWNFSLHRSEDHERFELEEESRQDKRFPVEEDSLGTYIMSSKDLCMIDHVGELCDAGIASLKIEGRMKSEYYAAVTSNAYRMALDEACGGESHAPGELLSELESVSHREYATGYFYDDCAGNPQLISDISTGYIREKAFLAVSSGYDPEKKTACFVQRNKFYDGDTVRVVSPGKLSRIFTASGMRGEDGKPLESVPHPYMSFSLEVPFEIKEGDILCGA